MAFFAHVFPFWFFALQRGIFAGLDEWDERYEYDDRV
jgi:hypothetical protein